MTPDLKELRKLLAASTKGPWSFNEDNNCSIKFSNGSSIIDGGQQNSEFIVALVNSAESLLDELEALRVSAEAGKKLREAVYDATAYASEHVKKQIDKALAAYDEAVGPKE